MQATQTNLNEYQQQAQEVSNLVIKYEKGYETNDLNFAKVQPNGFNEQEYRIFADYTDATCKQAQSLHERALEIAKYFAIFLMFLFLMLLALVCCGGLTSFRLKRYKKKDDYFGPNVGCDNLTIDHHWQEHVSEHVPEPEPVPEQKCEPTRKPEPPKPKPKPKPKKKPQPKPKPQPRPEPIPEPP